MEKANEPGLGQRTDSTGRGIRNASKVQASKASGYAGITRLTPPHTHICSPYVITRTNLHNHYCYPFTTTTLAARPHSSLPPFETTSITNWTHFDKGVLHLFPLSNIFLRCDGQKTQKSRLSHAEKIFQIIFHEENVRERSGKKNEMK